MELAYLCSVHFSHSTLRPMQRSLYFEARKEREFPNYFESEFSVQQLRAAALSMRIDRNGCMVVWYVTDIRSVSTK